MYGWHDGGMGWGGWLLIVVLMVLFWSAIVAGGVMFFRHLRGGFGPTLPYPPAPPGGPGPDQALRILEDRFARGEIDADEFTKRRDLIRSQ